MKKELLKLIKEYKKWVSYDFSDEPEEYRGMLSLGRQRQYGFNQFVEWLELKPKGKKK